MKDRELTLFRIGTERTTFMHWTIRPNIGTALKLSLLGASAIGVGLVAKYAADWVDDIARPQYIVNGNLPQWIDKESK